MLFVECDEHLAVITFSTFNLIALGFSRASQILTGFDWVNLLLISPKARKYSMSFVPDAARIGSSVSCHDQRSHVKPIFSQKGDNSQWPGIPQFIRTIPTRNINGLSIRHVRNV